MRFLCLVTLFLNFKYIDMAYIQQSTKIQYCTYVRIIIYTLQVDKYNIFVMDFQHKNIRHHYVKQLCIIILQV